MADPDWDGHCAEPAVARLKEATGRDLWGELGGCPRSWREAAAFYRKLGVRNLKGAVTKVLGKPQSPLRAMRGDIVLIGGALGVVRGDLVECLDGMKPIGAAECAWPITGKPQSASGSRRRKNSRSAPSPKKAKGPRSTKSRRPSRTTKSRTADRG
jgi:hypothetical protein